MGEGEKSISAVGPSKLGEAEARVSCRGRAWESSSYRRAEPREIRDKILGSQRHSQ